MMIITIICVVDPGTRFDRFVGKFHPSGVSAQADSLELGGSCTTFVSWET